MQPAAHTLTLGEVAFLMHLELVIDVHNSNFNSNFVHAHSFNSAYGVVKGIDSLI